MYMEIIFVTLYLSFFCMYIEDNFRDFMFVFLHTDLFMKEGSSLKGMNLLPGEQILF